MARTGSATAGAGGGGLTAVGQSTKNTSNAGDGGDGYAFTIGSQTYTVGGGGGGGNSSGVGGLGGGGSSNAAGTVNTGGGGGGAGGTSGSGGSGLVVLRMSRVIVLSVGAGITYTSTADEDTIIYEFTSGTDTVVFS